MFAVVQVKATVFITRPDVILAINEQHSDVIIGESVCIFRIMFVMNKLHILSFSNHSVYTPGIGSDPQVIFFIKDYACDVVTGNAAWVLDLVTKVRDLTS